MDDTTLHAQLAARGYVLTHNGGNTHVFIKGNIVVSGADGDLPSEHWYCVALYDDWENCGDALQQFSDWSAESGFADMGEPRDIWSDIDTLERMSIGAEYKAIIGYDPFEDDPAMTTDEGRALLDEVKAAWEGE